MQSTQTQPPTNTKRALQTTPRGGNFDPVGIFLHFSSTMAERSRHLGEEVLPPQDFFSAAVTPSHSLSGEGSSIRGSFYPISSTSTFSNSQVTHGPYFPILPRFSKVSNFHSKPFGFISGISRSVSDLSEPRDIPGQVFLVPKGSGSKVQASALKKGSTEIPIFGISDRSIPLQI